MHRKETKICKTLSLFIFVSPFPIFEEETATKSDLLNGFFTLLFPQARKGKKKRNRNGERRRKGKKERKKKKGSFIYILKDKHLLKNVNQVDPLFIPVKKEMF